MIILLVVGGIYYWKSRDKEAPTTGEAIELLTETPALTDVVTPTNPLGDKVPEVNPVDKTNPFKDTYKNPFSN
ncbi:MAG TPA: hypothetical protein VJH70_01385 [Candidatus Paceibacterota bacterium]